jgi:hypothetical protein
VTELERLARAVLLFHRGGPWTEADRYAWRGLTGEDEATTKVLCDLARQTVTFVERVEARQRANGCNRDDEPDQWGRPCCRSCVCADEAARQGLAMRAGKVWVRDGF